MNHHPLDFELAKEIKGHVNSGQGVTLAKGVMGGTLVNKRHVLKGRYSMVMEVGVSRCRSSLPTGRV